jgi:hypothetical protein
MSTLTFPPKLHGPQWVTMRQHRTTARAFAVLVLLSALTVTAYLIIANGDPKTEFARNTDAGMTFALARVTNVLALLPAVVGAFVAGPLVARELESGTYTWLWTQSVAPVRWLAAKLALATAVTLSGTAVLVVLFRLARGALPESSVASLAWYDSAYELLGPVAVAQCALGIGVGALVGLLMRRTVPSMVVAGLTVLVTQMVFMGLLREKLWPVERIFPKEMISSTPTVQIVSDGMLTDSGEQILWSTCYGPTGVGGTTEECMTKLGGVRIFADTHPESHFWPLQLIESGLLLALAGIAVAVAFRVLRRRHGVGA